MESAAKWKPQQGMDRGHDEARENKRIDERASGKTNRHRTQHDSELYQPGKGRLMEKDNDEIPKTLQHVLWFLLLMVAGPILVSWYGDYGHWLRAQFPEPPKHEAKP